MPRQLVLYASYPPSTVPLIDLKPIRIADLLMETHHRGKVLFLRTITSSIAVTGLETLVEDIHGDVEKLIIYFADPSSHLVPQKVLPKGAVVAIKEPYYTRQGMFYQIQVDQPSDLNYVYQGDPLFPESFTRSVPPLLKVSAAELKMQGNTAYSKKEYEMSVRLYTEGLTVCGADVDHSTLRYDLLRNRAAARLKLQYYELAEADALSAIMPGEDNKAMLLNSKALLRAGTAAYELEDFHKAIEYLGKALELDADGATQSVFDRAKVRLLEQSTGAYDIPAISDSVSVKHNHVDHASFFSNTEIRDAGSRGRGLFATRPIRFGELILCEKAFVAVYSCHYPKGGVSRAINLNSDSISEVPGGNLLHALTEKLRRNPKQARDFFKLESGNYKPHCTAPIIDGQAVIDVFHVHAIQQRNGFGCPERRNADEVVRENAKTAPLNSGVWIRTSYINHACDGNARRTFIGDLLFVHASKDIAQGEEILQPYKMPESNLHESQIELKKTWKFECDCPICLAERSTPPAQLKERLKLLEKVKQHLAGDTGNIADDLAPARLKQAETLYRDLEATYDKTAFSGLPRLGLREMGRLCYWGHYPQIERSIGIARKHLENLGFSISVKGDVLTIDHRTGMVTDGAMADAMFISRRYAHMGRKKLARAFETFAQDMFRITHGELRNFEHLGT
jgi:tetratricopeptide (TPR) repeat protein